jgi:hypothetical protein
LYPITVILGASLIWGGKKYDTYAELTIKDEHEHKLLDETKVPYSKKNADEEDD